MKLTFDVPVEMAGKIAENIKAVLNKYKKKQVCPQKGDKYWYIRFNNTIDHTVWDNMTEEFQMLEIGNVFRTQEEAEFKTEQLKVLHELEELADDDRQWCNRYYKHYYLEYNYDTNDVELNYDYSLKHNMIYFKSEESAQKAIDEIGKDLLKKYYFCISEKENE